MNEQMNIFDFIEPDPLPGDWIEEDLVGRELSFDEITGRIGMLIVMDMNTSSHRWYKVVRVERIVTDKNERRLFYYDGTRQRGIVSEMFFNPKIQFPARAYELKET